MNLKSLISSTCCFLRLALAPIVALSLVVANVATVNADPHSSATSKQKKVQYVKKYVMVVGSNIPVPVWEAEGPQPKTSVPIRTYTAEELMKMGAATPAQGLANDPSITIRGLGR
jgi:hypothetical protein